MYTIVGLQHRKGEYQGHKFEHLIFHTLSQRNGVEGQAVETVCFSLNRLSPDVRSLVSSFKVGDKVSEFYYDKYHKPCGVIK